MDEIKQWFNGIPIVTKWLFTSTLAISLAGGFGLIDPRQLILSSNVIQKLEFYRLLTNFFYCGTGLPLLMNLYFLYRQSSELETGLFASRTADFVFFVMISMAMLDVRNLSTIFIF